MRIAGSQSTDATSAAILELKKEEKERDKNKSIASDAGTAVTARDLEKSTLFGILFSEPQPTTSTNGDAPVSAAASATDSAESPHIGSRNPGSILSIYA
jgi:hypothetical protein